MTINLIGKLKSRRCQASLISLFIYSALFLSTGYAATAAEEARIAQCPDGQYAGPGTGTRRFIQDPYVWFASREFAKRFCMPESMIDDSLKGALAIAVRLKPNEEVTCGMYMGRSDQCPVKMRLLLDIYVDNRKANIPKFDPNVEYFSGRVWNSGWYLGASGYKADRRRKGQITETSGERRPFSPYVTNIIKREDWTRFLYVSIRNGWASMEGDFIEDYYRANWVDGIDLITLDAYNFGYSEARNPDAPPDPKDPYYKESVKGFAIAVLEGKKESPYGNWWQANDYNKKNLAYPKDYLHTIELPHKVAQMIYAYDHKQGEQFFNDIKHANEPADNK